MAHDEFKLSLSIIGRSEISRILRELSRLDDYFVASHARKAGTGAGTPPRISHLLDELARTNGLNLLEAAQRKQLADKLNQLLASAPTLNIIFASEPSPKALERITAWFRENIHPQALLQVGLQPSIAAGCVLRTPNQLFDMSISSRLKQEEQYLAQLIAGAVK